MKPIGIAVCLALVLLAAGCSSPTAGYEMGRDRYGPIPAPDPARKISRQDCTEPLRLDGGNLMCK